MNIILLSGGSGQRLWPLSNEIRSKQFIKIFHTADGGLESMVQRVCRQIREVDPEAQVTIATSKSQVSAIYSQLGQDVGVTLQTGHFPGDRAVRGISEGCAGGSRRRTNRDLPGGSLCGDGLFSGVAGIVRSRGRV